MVSNPLAKFSILSFISLDILSSYFTAHIGSFYFLDFYGSVSIVCCFYWFQYMLPCLLVCLFFSACVPNVVFALFIETAGSLECCYLFLQKIIILAIQFQGLRYLKQNYSLCESPCTSNAPLLGSSPSSLRPHSREIRQPPLVGPRHLDTNSLQSGQKHCLTSQPLSHSLRIDK